MTLLLFKYYMEAPISFRSILALYFSKQSVGTVHFNRNLVKIECGLMQGIIANSQKQLHRYLSIKRPQLILTNNDRHAYFSSVPPQTKISKLDERGLQDDIIENNISLLKFNPIKESINNKSQYIKMMRQSSQATGFMKQKYRALGMMLYYLFNQDDVGVVNKIYLDEIHFFFDPIFKHVQITNSQLETFQIVKQEVHPSLIKGKGRSKEGFSLLSLYETTLSSGGSKKILRNIFRNPSYDNTLLESRYDLISWLKKYCNDYKNMIKTFRSVHAVDTLLRKLSDSRIETDDWRKLTRSLESMIILHKVIQEKIRSSEDQGVPSFISLFFHEINWVEIARILSTILSTLQLQQGSIKKGVDLQLDELKKTYDNLPHLLTLYARQQNWSSDFRIVFMAQIGYLIRVPHESQIPAKEQQSWSLQFIKNSGKFYSNELTQMLDSQYGDVYGEITDREKKINFQLQNIVFQHQDMILRAYWKTCQLQCYLGISIVSTGMCRPRLSSQSLIISRGWHVLLAQDAIENNSFSFNQNLAPRQRVYNSEENLVNTNYSNRLMLITGPNGSGKTIYMKQVCLIIYLAHLGFFVPAEFAQIPLVDKIVLVQTKKSIYQGHNGFESEISSLSRILSPGLVTNKSLILIDELGSSIDQLLGKKMLLSLILFLMDPSSLHFIKNENLSLHTDKFSMPLTLIITHLSDIMNQGIIEEGYILRYLAMNMQNNQTFLYKIKPGLVKKGYGIECAKAYMTEGFISKALTYSEHYKQQHT